MISISVARGFWYLIHVSNFRGLSMFELLLFKLTVTTKPKFFFLSLFSFPHQIKLDWSIITEWQMDGWSDQLSYGLTDWLTECWTVGSLTSLLSEWLTRDRLTDYPTDLLTDWTENEQMNRWTDGWTSWLPKYLRDWLTYWLINLLTDWLPVIDLLTDWPTSWLNLVDFPIHFFAEPGKKN